MRGGPSLLPIMEDLAERLHDVASEAAGLGYPFARTYIAAAITSLRLAHASLLVAEDKGSSGSKVEGAAIRLTFADGLPTGVFMQPERGCHVRGRCHDGAFVHDPRADGDLPLLRPVDLGADILRSDDARSLAAGSVAAALLADALGSRSWKHPASPHPWSVGKAAARSLVSALAGTAVRPLAAELSGVILDREALVLIESLGWRRHVGDMDVGRRDE